MGEKEKKEKKDKEEKKKKEKKEKATVRSAPDGSDNNVKWQKSQHVNNVTMSKCTM